MALLFFLCQAAYYDIRYAEVTNTSSKSTGINFDNAVKLKNTDILFGDLNDTKEAYEEYRIVLKPEVFSNTDGQYLISAKAIDNGGQSSKQDSNIFILCPNCMTRQMSTSGLPQTAQSLPLSTPMPSAQKISQGLPYPLIIGVVAGAGFITSLIGLILYRKSKAFHVTK